ncbi:unnamed protein product, partial [Prorocentrum cordatum]
PACSGVRMGARGLGTQAGLAPRSQGDGRRGSGRRRRQRRRQGRGSPTVHPWRPASSATPPGHGRPPSAGGSRSPPRTRPPRRARSPARAPRFSGPRARAPREPGPSRAPLPACAGREICLSRRKRRRGARENNPTKHGRELLGGHMPHANPTPTPQDF